MSDSPFGKSLLLSKLRRDFYFLSVAFMLPSLYPLRSRVTSRMVGYYNLMIKDKECEIGSLSVLPEYRHKLIGRTLLEDSLSKASEYGCTIMKLSIVEENRILRKWYEDQGFVHTGTVKYDFFPFTCGYLEREL